MRIIALITHSANIRNILDHIGVDSEPPHIAPPRGPPLGEDGDALQGGATCMVGAKLPRGQSSRQRGSCGSPVCTGQGRFVAQSLCHTCPHGVEFPIPVYNASINKIRT